MCRPIRTPTGPAASASRPCAAADRLARIGERVEEGVTLRVDLDAAVGGERVAEPPVLGKGVRVASSPSSCMSFVEPSTSVNNKVTVPLGRSPRMRHDHPPRSELRVQCPTPPPREALGRRGLLLGVLGSQVWRRVWSTSAGQLPTSRAVLSCSAALRNRWICHAQ